MKILNTCKVGMALTAAAFLGLATSQRADAISFSLTDLGTLGGNSTYARDINNLGQVVGNSSTADGQSRAFLWDKNSGMTNLGTLPSKDNYCSGNSYNPCYSSSSSDAYAINDLGQVIGTSATEYRGGYAAWLFELYNASYEQHSFFWDNSSGMISLVPTGGYYNYTPVIGINNLGQVIGTGYEFGSRYFFFWEKNTSIIRLQWNCYYLGCNSANAINNSGQVVGSILRTESGTLRPYPFLWEKNTGMVYLGTLGVNYGSANAINDLGQVVGSSTTADGQNRAFLWEKNSGMINLGTLGGYYDSYGYPIDYSSATAINDYGQVVGSSTTADGQNRAFFWDNSNGMIDLGSLGGNSSDAKAINNLGQVIGYSTTANGQNRPFFWDKSSGMSDLNDLVSPAGWIINTIAGINNAGQIVGNGLYNGQYRAFVLTPNTSKSVPEPSSALAFLALGAVGAGSLAKRQRQQQEASSRN
ncbi:MAG TPA: hypothetical protein DCY88_23680 [Cyanobacteria bacterium UBA11372]|nr:hypothetical protein [Cyanobacteria bacterium UBA11372]